MSELPHEAALAVDKAYPEIWGVKYVRGTLVRGRVGGSVVRFNAVVDGLCSEFGVQLAGFAVKARTVVVVDAVGHIGRLLDFGEGDARSDGVHSSCREVEHVAGLHAMSCKHLGDGAVGDSAPVFFGGDGALESGVETGAALSIDYVPHLGLAHFAVFAEGHFVARVHLD